MDSAKLLSVSCAAKQATWVDHWRLVWERTWLSFVVGSGSGIAACGLVPQVLLFLELDQCSPVTWSMTSSPLPVLAVTLFVSGSGCRTAALWVSATDKAVNCVFFAGWTGRFVAVPSCLRLPSPGILPSQVVGFHPPPFGVVPSVDFASTQAKLGSSWGYAGQVVARGLTVVDSMVGSAWSRKEHMGVGECINHHDECPFQWNCELRASGASYLLGVTALI